MTERPKIEFPCLYPIKVIGINHVKLKETVVQIVRRHAPDLLDESVTLRDSRGGNYRSVRFAIQATGEAQLKALHRDLLTQPLVKLVL